MKYAPIEIKERAVYLFLFEGYPYPKLEKIFNYSAAAIKTWVVAYKNGELWSIKARGRPTPRLDDADYQFIKKQISSVSHTTVRGITALLNGKCGKTTVHNAIRKMGLTYKKNSSRG